MPGEDVPPFQCLASQWLAKAWGAKLGKLHWLFNAQPFQSWVPMVSAQGNCTLSSVAGLSQAALCTHFHGWPPQTWTGP